MNELQNQKGDFLTNPQLLNGNIVRQYLDPKGAATNEELAYFVAQAKARNLNPFTKEIYFIKYGTQPAQIVVSKDAFMKRAEQNPNYDGFESGVVYADANGEIKNKRGVMLPKEATLLGGWCEVYRKDRSRPVYREVELSAYTTGKNWWQKSPAQMIEKVAIVAATRDAFPEDVGGLYAAEEMEQAKPTDVTPQETKEEVSVRRLEEARAQREILAQQAEANAMAQETDADVAEEEVEMPEEEDFSDIF